jgi:hypothetical protein
MSTGKKNEKWKTFSRATGGAKYAKFFTFQKFFVSNNDVSSRCTKSKCFEKLNLPEGLENAEGGF